MTNENKPQAPLAPLDGYEVVIGIEIHCQLNTKPKFSHRLPPYLGKNPTPKPILLT
jgi:aspartyl-tRNA(Asn)/glutamyl-tRNA(Gln) amidotransferase subunit B